MTLYKHSGYDEYYKAQVAKNSVKLHKVFVTQPMIDVVSSHIKNTIPNPSFGLCHGVRNAFEVNQLRKVFSFSIIGTEISPTANQFRHVLHWDFHKIKDEWVDSVDFIYSNSFDHSYKPAECLDQWMKCIKQTGLCYIHWSRWHMSGEDAADCFGGSYEDLRVLISKKYMITEELTMDIERPNGTYPETVYVIGHKKKSKK